MNEQTLLGIVIGLAAYPFFWLFFVVTTILLAAAVAKENGFFTTVLTIGVGVLAVAKWPALIDVISNPVTIVLLIIAYALGGIAWSRVKWGKFVNKKFEQEVSKRNRFIESNNLSKDFFKVDQPDNAGLLKKYARSYANLSEYSVDTVEDLNKQCIPAASANKASIIMWIAYWPISLLYYLFADLLADLGNFIYNKIGGYFQSVATNKFENL